MPDDALFNRIGAYADSAEAYLRTLLGDELYEQRNDGSRLDTLGTRIVCLHAYKNAIPHLDLVLTDNGFGVVRNQNVTPASPERVARLLTQLSDDLDDTVDETIDMLRGNPAWVNTNAAIQIFRSLVWNARKQLRYFGSAGHRAQLDELRPKISGAEQKIKHCISDEFFNELCDALRLNNATDMQAAAVHMALEVIACDVTGAATMARHHILRLVAFLDANIRTFPTYANSTAYAANTFKPYKNEKDDPCYFFG